MNTKLANEVNKPRNKFYTRDMLLKSRLGQNELKNNMKNKSKGDMIYLEVHSTKELRLR